MGKILTATIVGFILLTARPVFAQEVFNSNTGADSVNVTEIKIENEGDYEVKNDAKIVNEVYGDVNTGYNEASKNTGGEEVNGEAEVVGGGEATIETGNATFNARIVNKANVNDIEVDACCEEDGKGGGEEKPPIKPLPPEGGIGGGELALAEGLGGGELALGDVLPEAGIETWLMALLAAGVITLGIRMRALKLKNI